jgi:hypothetical protein
MLTTCPGMMGNQNKVPSGSSQERQELALYDIMLPCKTLVLFKFNGPNYYTELQVTSKFTRRIVKKPEYLCIQEQSQRKRAANQRTNCEPLFASLDHMLKPIDSAQSELMFPIAPMKLPVNRENLLRKMVEFIVVDDQVCISLMADRKVTNLEFLIVLRRCWLLIKQHFDHSSNS